MVMVGVDSSSRPQVGLIGSKAGGHLALLYI